jgi:hypothetical protein
MADITYILNDPSTPNLVEQVQLPARPGVLDFKVDGYRGATTVLYSLEHQAACCYNTIVNAINLINATLLKPVEKWSSVQTLLVEPRAGKQLNAYYDRMGLKFFYATDPVTKNMVYASNSTDVVAHELGHALLDALRPDLYNVQAMEIWAFHESFGDIHAIINLLQHDLVLDTMIQETAGDLRKPNVATRLAEEMGAAIYHMTGGRMGYSAGFLRNAVNDFNYSQPETLPRQGRDDQLTSEPHNFSRVFTGVWYDILVGIYEVEKQTLPPKAALIKARDTMARYTFRSLRMAPANIRFYDSIAKSMLVVDKGNNYSYNSIMNQAFIKRGILREPVKPMIDLNWMLFQPSIEASDEIMEESNVIAVRNKKTELLPLPHFMMNVEAPNDTFYEFNGTGECVGIISSDIEELIEHAHCCVEFLKHHDMIRPDKLSPFELTNDGNLIRSHFSKCFNNNQLPGQPEYLKAFKPENNGGCSCSGKKKPVCSTASVSKCGNPIPMTIVSKKVRF